MASCKCKPIQSLPHRVTVESATYAQDAHNEEIATWSTHAKRRGFCRATRPREVIQAEQVVGELGWMVELPYDSKTTAITSGMRMTLHDFDDRTVYCDGPAMPLNGEKFRVRVRCLEETA